MLFYVLWKAKGGYVPRLLPQRLSLHFIDQLVVLLPLSSALSSVLLLLID